MASAVETQRLISVSLGKIAQSRAQRGGINLHKNLLVASVLNKARTAFMMENYNHHLSLQQKQQQIILTTLQPASFSNSVSTANEQQNAPSQGDETCRATPFVENRSTSVPAQTSSELVADSSKELNGAPLEARDKENISPACENSLVLEEDCDCKQDVLSSDHHIQAANQLSHDAQLAGHNTSSSLLSSCKLTSASTTCSVLKRRRINPEAVVSVDSDCPANKKARISSDGSHLQSSDISSSENEESDMQTSDSPQISNLVSIFNSGFSGLCVSSSSSTSYESSFQPDNSSVSNQWSSSRTLPDSQSLHCSSQVERIGAISSAIVLSA